MATYPLCNETIVRSLLMALEPEPSENADGTQRMDTYTKYPQWDLHLVRRGNRGPEPMTVSIAAPTKPEFSPGQVPVFANLVVRSGLSKKNGSAYEIVSADAVTFVNTTEFSATLDKQRKLEIRATTATTDSKAAA